MTAIPSITYSQLQATTLLVDDLPLLTELATLDCGAFSPPK
ncbi:hypothetical protein [Microcoleus sp. PH2017_22_RUC_O_B]|nr:hypothetical protein [Microcoleus sp. PH2017_22_RUC_O_B]